VEIQFSIVTAVLNRRTMIGRAIDSVCKQGLEGIEHIVVDGGSTDGTLDVLKKYQHLDVSSGADVNLYDAWNKGIQRAKGSFIIILNSDDELPENSLDTARKILKNAHSIDMISGSVELRCETDAGKYETRLIDDPAILKLRNQDIISGVPLTNARYISRQFLHKIGPFDKRYDIISDRQFFLRALLQQPKNITTQSPLYRYYIHDGSLSLNGKGPSVYLSRQCLTAASDGMKDAESTVAFSAYRKWHAWSAFYLSYLHARNGSFVKATKVFSACSSKDPLWLGRLPIVIARHVAERSKRRGRMIE